MSISSRMKRNGDGVAAIEFAFIAPLFITILFSMVGWGIYLGASHSSQQIAADAARVAVAGLDSHERIALAQSFIDSMDTEEFVLIDQSKLAVLVEDDASRQNQFTVKLTYDAGELPIWNLLTFAMPEKIISRSATIRSRGV